MLNKFICNLFNKWRKVPRLLPGDDEIVQVKTFNGIDYQVHEHALYSSSLDRFAWHDEQQNLLLSRPVKDENDKLKVAQALSFFNVQTKETVVAWKK